MYSWLPSYFYPAYERITGRKCWSLTQELLSLQWRSPEELQRRTEEKLRKLLCHAYEHTSYYRDLLLREGIEVSDIKSLDDFSKVPITTKTNLRQNFPDKIVAANLPSQRRILAKTSGSSGVPFEFYTDQAARDVRGASHDFFKILAGITPAESLIVIMSQREHAQPKPLQSRIRRLLAGSTTQYLSGLDATLSNFCKVLENVSDYYIQGYPSYVARLVREVDKKGFNLKTYPKVVFTESETLTPLEAEQITNGFRCPVVNHYASFEFLYIAQSCPDNPDVMHVNSESILLEVVDQKGSPVTVGEKGRVVITDLHNYVMPFVRYDIGDVAVAGGRCSCGRGLPTLESLEGRSNESICTPSGKIITSGIFGTRLFVDGGFLPFVYEYQTIQTDLDKVVLKLIPTKLFESKTEAALTSYLRKLLGPDMEVTLEIVNQIPNEPNEKRLIIKSLISRSN